MAHVADDHTPPQDSPTATRPSTGTSRRSRGRSSAASRFGKRIQRRRSVWMMSLNLTPMIDVVFLLLFFFLAVSRFRALEGMLPAQLPTQKVATTVEIPRIPIRIRLLADPKAPMVCHATIDRFEEAPIRLDALATALRDIRENAPGFDRDTPVQLWAGDEVVWDHIVNAYNATMAAKYKNILFAGSP